MKLNSTELTPKSIKVNTDKQKGTELKENKEKEKEKKQTMKSLPALLNFQQPEEVTVLCH